MAPGRKQTTINLDGELLSMFDEYIAHITKTTGISRVSRSLAAKTLIREGLRLRLKNAKTAKVKKTGTGSVPSGSNGE